MKKFSLLFSGLFISMALFAQKDSLQLSCPLNNIIIKDPNKTGPYHYDQPDRKLILVSPTDTSFLSPVDGKIFSISMGDEKKYEIVMYYRDYYIWIIGVTKPVVKRNQVVKRGQQLARISPNEEIEFLLFKNDTPLDPRGYLECK